MMNVLCVVNYGVMLYGACVACMVCLCVLRLRGLRDVWRDGVWFVVCCCLCLCVWLLICLCDVCLIYFVLLSGVLFVRFCNCACGF